jgi:hypothetical protein
MSTGLRQSSHVHSYPSDVSSMGLHRMRTPTRTLIVAVPTIAAAACVSTSYPAAPVPPPLATLRGEEPGVHVSIHENRREVEVVAGPFEIPSATLAAPHGGHAGHDGDESMKSPLVVFPWPVDAALIGVRLVLYAPDGERLSRDMLHHLIGVNFARRQLVYPVPERIFGFGTETPDVRLPDFLEVPLQKGDSLAFYAMWSDSSSTAMSQAYVQLILPYGVGRREREKALPIYMDTSNQIGGKTSFDLPPGRSSRTYEFSLPVGGGLLAASGHLHDHGVELRLEEAASGRVLMTLEPETDPGGHVRGVEQRIFRRFFNLLDARLRLEAGVRYRVVGVYDNTTGGTLLDGGMAHIVGLFVPDDIEAWPARDPEDRSYRADIEALPDPLAGGHFRH